MFVLYLALQLACFLSLPRDRARKFRKQARETHETLQLQTPGERAQRASKGCTRPTTLAILMLAMLSPRWLRGASWCFALVLLAVLCASLLVCPVAVEACGLAPEQGYRLALRLVCFRSLPLDRARKLRKRRTRNSRLCLVVLCLGSSRRCLCSSPRRLRRLRLSLIHI